MPDEERWCDRLLAKIFPSCKIDPIDERYEKLMHDQSNSPRHD